MSAPTHNLNSQTNTAAPSAASREARQPAGVKIEKRKFFVPGGFVAVVLGDEAVEGVEVWRDPSKPVACGFSGKRGKPDWYYRFQSEERMQQHIDAWLKRLNEVEGWKAQRRAERRAVAEVGHGCKVGDIFCCSWGYDQTNVDYYQITELHGRTMATVRRIAAQTQETGWLQGECAPAPGRFLDEERYPAMRVRINGAQPRASRRTALRAPIS